MTIRPLRRALQGARRLHEDEGGAALLFAVITLFSLALAMMMIFQVGLVTTDRMQIQTAADAAAYSGAQVEANAINSIGQINDGMAYVHYACLRYVLDQIVYGTLHQFETHKDFVAQSDPNLLAQGDREGVLPNPTYIWESGPMIEGGPRERHGVPDWVMLGDEDQWNRRWERTQQGTRAIEEGKRWLLELNAASHLILKATPRLVREKAAEIAFRNGASHVAVSSDLEKAMWTEGGELGDGIVDAVGLTDNSEVADSLARRYLQRKLVADGDNPVTEFPSWFPNATKVNGPAYTGNGYTSVRICWNPNDWAHGERGDGHSLPPWNQWRGVPNGHWHGLHLHVWMDHATTPPTPTPEPPHGGLAPSVVEASTAGGGKGGGHGPDDYRLHGLVEMDPSADPTSQAGTTIEHHAIVTCPTCQSQDGLAAAAEFPGERWPAVKKDTKTHTATSNDPGLTLELKFEGDFPKPLLLAAPLLRSSVTVATWRESHGIGTVLPKSDWGMLAIASAQIGLLDEDGRVRGLQKLESNQATYGSGDEFVIELQRDKDTSYRNLHYSHDNANFPGIRFGARLVPIRGELTHHPTLQSSGAVEELLKDGSRWLTTRDFANPAPSNTEAGDPPGRAKLRRWFAVNSFEELREVFWH